MQNLRFQLVFHHARSTDLHRPLMGAGGNTRRFTHHRDLFRLLAQAHGVQQMLQGDEGHRCAYPGAGLAAHLIEPVHDPLVEGRVVADGIEHPLTIFQQPGQQRVKLADRVGVIDAVARDCALGTGAPPVPGFHQRVALAAEQQEFLLAARHQHGNGFRFRKAGQVIEITVLTEGIMDIAVAGRL